jgi:hypothetical protein
LDLAARDEASGLGDAPWPPHYRKMDGEAPRVSPSRRAKAPAGEGGATDAPKPKRAPRAKMPLVIVAQSPKKDEALAGLERWKARHAEISKLLAVDDILVDSMRGRSSTWTRIRINLRHVPEAQRPPVEPPDPDDDPTREWRNWRKQKSDGAE